MESKYLKTNWKLFGNLQFPGLGSWHSLWSSGLPAQQRWEWDIILCSWGFICTVPQPEGGWLIAKKCSLKFRVICVLKYFKFHVFHVTATLMELCAKEGVLITDCMSYICFRFQKGRRKSGKWHCRRMQITGRWYLLSPQTGTWPLCVVKNPDASFFLFSLFIFGLWCERWGNPKPGSPQPILLVPTLTIIHHFTEGLWVQPSIFWAWVRY